MEEALQSGKSDIAEYLAPRTKLRDDRTYSVIPEAAVYGDAADLGAEEEKQSAMSDAQSMQSEEGIRPEDYQRTSAQEKKVQAAVREHANREAADEQRLNEISQEIKTKMNLQDFDVQVTKTSGLDGQAAMQD